uniref:Uncharacterized protein n=1 Tax=Solanum lycopersicum TaxID=4081 RepID=A0A3Q7F3L0_SOLLC
MIKKTRKICCITGLENESPNGSNMPCVLRCGVTLNMKFDRFGTHTQNITVIKMPFSFLNLKHNNFTQAKQPHSTPKDVLVDCVVVSEGTDSGTQNFVLLDFQLFRGGGDF